MSKNLIFVVILIIVVAAVGILYEQRLETQEKQETIKLVNNAVEIIEQNGEYVFPEIRTAEYKDDLYVFVWQLDGIRVVYPPDPSGEGQNMTNLTDVNGKPIGKLFIQAAKQGEGWVEYYWPKPGETEPSLKLTYIKKAQYHNQTYLVGCGYYVG